MHMLKSNFIIIIITFIILQVSHVVADEKFLSLKKNKVNVRYGPGFDFPIKYVYEKISKTYTLGRTRVLKKEPRSTLSWHKDPEPRLHIPIITNYGCRMVIDDRAYHMPADGSVYLTNTTKYHNFFNGGEEDRIHIVATLPNFKLFNNVNLTKETNRWVS